MRRFLVTLGIFGFLFIVFAELFLQFSGLASDVLIREPNYEESLIVHKPGREGFFTRGARREVYAKYSINKQGFNSIIEYDSIDSSTIALIGDSYIDGVWNDVDSTVAACLSRLIQINFPNIQVHSYGYSGANYLDYQNLIGRLREKGYNYIYVFVNVKDFSANRPSFTDGAEYQKVTGVRHWYRKSALLRYLNINLNIKKYFGKPNAAKRRNELARKKGYEKAASQIMTFPDKNAVFFYEDPFFDTLDLPNDLVKIEHTRQPMDHGFNGHWNVNGNKNAAESIYQHWKTNFAPSNSSN